jgi:hypothetical protein
VTRQMLNRGAHPGWKLSVHLAQLPVLRPDAQPGLHPVD